MLGERGQRHPCTVAGCVQSRQERVGAGKRAATPRLFELQTERLQGPRIDEVRREAGGADADGRAELLGGGADAAGAHADGGA